MLRLAFPGAPVQSANPSWVPSVCRGCSDRDSCLGNGQRKSCSSGRLVAEVAATSWTERHASNASSSQWFHWNVCHSDPTVHRDDCHNRCASLDTHLSSPAIVFVTKYVEVFPCRVEKDQQEPHFPDPNWTRSRPTQKSDSWHWSGSVEACCCNCAIGFHCLPSLFIFLAILIHVSVVLGFITFRLFSFLLSGTMSQGMERNGMA